MTPAIRAIGSGDRERLRAFFERVPPGDRTFFREDVLAAGVIEGWFSDGRGRRFVAVDGDGVAGYLAVIPQVGWSSHVGELRIVVDPGRRRQGVGRRLARHGLQEGLRLSLRKLVVEVVAEQEAALAMFAALGFEAEALLKDHVRDARGELHDLVTMVHFADATWDTLRTVGVQDLVEP